MQEVGYFVYYTGLKHLQGLLAGYAAVLCRGF